jgi:two-component system, NarL family, nitrate/nitrite response regulator NarL
LGCSSALLGLNAPFSGGTICFLLDAMLTQFPTAEQSVFASMPSEEPGMATRPSAAPLSEAPPASRSPHIRVVVAEETPLSCQLLKSALTHSRFRFDVVAYATNREELLRLLTTCAVDVALVTESLEDGPFVGFQLLSELRASFPTVRVIMLLKSATRDLVVDAFRAGAEGIICRTEPLQALCKCIQAVHAGQIWANSDQLHFVLEALISSTPVRVTNWKGEHLLTQKEDEIGNLVADGMTNREIAQKLGIAEHTVSNHLFRIYERLGISSRVELALYLLRQKGR